MKKLSLSKIKKQLIELGADDASYDLIISTVEHHNDLVADYNNGEKVQQYLCYQLKQQLFKMIQDLKKQNKKNDALTEEDELVLNGVLQMIDETKKKQPIGFAVNKKDCETR